MNQMRHVALIPDGNRRWARAHGKTPMEGHEAGAKTSEAVIAAAFDEGIPFVTIWGCSVGNLANRPPVEAAFLKRMFATYFRRLLQHPDIKKRDMRVRVLGRWREYFANDAITAIDEAVTETADHTKNHLTFLLAYSGLDELRAAIGKMREQGSGMPTEEEVKGALWTSDLPPVDLVIRTGGEPHFSQGFMMWDVAEAQLHFTETLWPDFSPEELRAILAEKHSTERRFGA